MLVTIKLPLYNQVSIECESIFWKQRFRDLAQELAPWDPNTTGIRLDIKPYRALHDNAGTDRDSIIKLQELAIELMRNSGIYSFKNIVDMDPQLSKNHNISYTSWSDIKAQNVKVRLLEQFASEYRAKHDLPNAMMKTLFNRLIFWFKVNTLTKDDILFDGNALRIVDIPKLAIDKNRKIILNKDIRSYIG
jgi:hypothetical protein